MKRNVPFLLVITLLSASQAVLSQSVQIGKTYLNISKGTAGGTIEPGDTLEIRATIAVGSGDIISRCRYNDTITPNTTYIPGSLTIRTNEGLVYQSFTDAGGDDAGMFDAVNNTLRINVGSYGKGVQGGICSAVDYVTTGGGRIDYNGRPSFYQSTAILSASYRIRINPGVAYGSTIQLIGGAYRYRTSGNVDIDYPTAGYTLAISPNLGLCSNAIGANAVIDNGGTFGNGTTQNRSTSAIIPGYNFTSVTGSQPADGSYAIVNNLSSSGSTDINAPIPFSGSPQQRVFGVWDIMGDHTGAASPAAGNLPVAPGNPGGYFVAINASITNANAIQQTVGGLCPNTYYEFSAWFKNICRYCACDSTAQPAYKNGSPNNQFKGPDSSGVNPNLTFTIDGVDYYTSGNILYDGQWVKKGFTYITKPGQTSFTITIRNNAPGGGGNDWAIDDVTLATCTPNLDLQPSPQGNVCFADGIDIFADVFSFFPNYTHYRWELSTDNGSSWNNTGISGNGTPAVVNGEYVYRATYPTIIGDSSTHNNLYRLRLATDAANLATSTCSFTATTQILVFVNNCSWLLKTDMLSFTGKANGRSAQLMWKASIDNNHEYFEIESSNDREHFEKTGTVEGSNGTNSYSFTDPKLLNGPRYYRLRITDGGSFKYSKIVVLSNESLEFGIQALQNPFNETIRFDLLSPEEGTATITLVDSYGRVVRHMQQHLHQGISNIRIHDTGSLPAGVYILQVQQKDNITSKRLLKNNIQ